MSETLLQLIGRSTQIWAVTRHQYGVSAFVSQRSFGGKSIGGRREKSAVLSFCQASTYLGGLDGALT